MSLQALEQRESTSLLSDSEWASYGPRSPRAPDRVGVEAFSITASPVFVPFADGHLIFSEPPPAWFKPILEKICTLDQLSANWDSYGGRAVKPQCAAATIALLLSILGPDDPTPAVVPTNRGGLQIEWHRGGIDLEIRIDSPAKYHVLYVDDQTGDEEEFVVTNDFGPLFPLIERLTARN